MEPKTISLIGIIIIGGLSIFGIAYTNYTSQAYVRQSIDNQKQSFDDLIAFMGIKTYMNENGNAGMFDSNKQMLYVKTDRASKESCLMFLHELGHSIQSKNNDSCYYSKDLNACETGAIQYVKDNAYRCEGLE